jgi:hypothetical protein
MDTGDAVHDAAASASQSVLDGLVRDRDGDADDCDDSDDSDDRDDSDAVPQKFIFDKNHLARLGQFRPWFNHNPATGESSCESCLLLSHSSQSDWGSCFSFGAAEAISCRSRRPPVG